MLEQVHGGPARLTFSLRELVSFRDCASRSVSEAGSARFGTAIAESVLGMAARSMPGAARRSPLGPLLAGPGTGITVAGPDSSSDLDCAGCQKQHGPHRSVQHGQHLRWPDISIGIIETGPG